MNTKIYLKALLIAMTAGSLASCNDYLDKEPLSNATPENYFTQVSHLEAYANGRYTEVLPSSGNWSYGTYGGDLGTDNMVSQNYDDIYVPGKWKTSMNDVDNYTFTVINTINYFFDQVMPKYEAGEIVGEAAPIRHYIGEMHFFRAYQYFTMMQRYGDFPIITTCLSEDINVLSEASRRYPQNEVARFILEELDKAIELLSASNMATTRINADVARLIKSRVALYEGTWLKNFAGTPFVPGDKEWPGYQKGYNKDFKYQTGSVDAEANWFLDQAISAAKEVGDKAVLIQNTGVVPDKEAEAVEPLEAENPWLAMFATLDLSSNKEVLLWRQYSRALGIVHNIPVYAQKGNRACGSTRSLVQSFVMANGLPIYAAGSGYAGDDLISNVRKDRDPRLFVFLKEPGQKNILVPGSGGTHATPVEPYPLIMESNVENVYSTGYALRKGNYYSGTQCDNGNGSTACPVFRSVEALLNYIEAYYERYGTLDGTAQSYWTKIRARHTGLDQDFNKTIAATDMTIEAQTDWGAYTAGTVIDPVRFNIRRERRCELVAEDFRWMDLKRWRSFDQLMTTPYHVEGIHIWGTPMEKWYDKEELENTISSSKRSEYLRPFEAKEDSEVWDGLKWSMAHYLRPIPIFQMMLTAPDSKTVADSPIYQNPYWPTEPNMAATR
uniref:Starch-binding protein n=1 Tax=uncultured Muribaculaceae bacterium TaxID=2301481 RepID=A0A6G8F3E8_9BACT|nr:starch-binding protein [uncultured Muribaculaceae bacterium]